MSVCHFCCPELSVDVWNRCLGAFKVKCMYVCWVWMHQMVYLSVQALNGAANALYWNISERLNCIHLTLLKHQNTKTALSKLSKNHWGFAFFKKFGSVRKKLQFTVFLDHPVCSRHTAGHTTHTRQYCEGSSMSDLQYLDPPRTNFSEMLLRSRHTTDHTHNPLLDNIETLLSSHTQQRVTHTRSLAAEH